MPGARRATAAESDLDGVALHRVQQRADALRVAADPVPVPQVQRAVAVVLLGAELQNLVVFSFKFYDGKINV